MTRHLLLISFIGFLFFGCKQEDITPSWIKINEFGLITNIETQGWDTHGITDAWVYLDNEHLGVHQVPCTIPVLAEGEHTFTILPGIKNNGISSTRRSYPFYQPFEVTGTLTKNDTFEINPITAYRTSVEFAFIEDFENAGISFLKGPASDTNFVFVNEDEHPEIVEYGDKCGGIFLTELDSLFTANTEEFMNLPKGEEVYLEIDYRNNNSIAMGVLARYPDGTV